MYCVQLKLPLVSKFDENEKRYEDLDEVILNKIISGLHLSEYKAKKMNSDYLFAINFPSFIVGKFGEYMQIISNCKNTLLEHIKQEEVIYSISNHCNIKIVDLNKEEIDSYHSMRMSRKSGTNYNMSQIKRLISRKKGFIYQMNQDGLSNEEIFKILNNEEKSKNYLNNSGIKITAEKNSKNCFKNSIEYTTKRNEKMKLYIDFIDCSDNETSLGQLNSFGFGNGSVLPRKIF